MTREEKAKAYDNVVNKLRRFMEHGIEPLITRADVQDFFPELTESEDELIRKEIIAFLKENLETGRAEETWSLSGLERWIAWLEKQGKSKWTESDEHHLRMCLECVEECAFQDREDFSKTIDWLKSLKQKLEEQQ